MNRFISLVLLVAASAISLSCWAQGAEGTNGILFKVTGGGLTEPSYVFGSFHVVSGPLSHDIPHFDEIWERVGTVCFETDMSAEADSASAVAAKGVTAESADGLAEPFLPGNKTYYHVLGEKAALDIDSVMTSLYPQFVSNMHPLYASQILRLLISQYQAELIGGQLIPMDQYLRDKAQKDGKQIAWLEPRQLQDSLALQLQAYNVKKLKDMAAMPLKKQMRKFYDECLDAGSKIERMTRIKQYYRNAQGRELVAAIQEEGNDDMMSLMAVRERNALWMQSLPKVLSEGPSLVVVGLAHLYPYRGAEGLIHDLTAAGYTLTPM